MENQPDEIAPIKAGRERYQQTGDAGALGESLRLGRQAVARLAGSGESAAIAALELAASLGLLYETDGQVEHLDEALSLLEGAVRVLPAGHEDLVPVYTNIAALRLARFTRVGDVGDLQSAVATGRLGAGCSRQDDPALATRYANLTGALRTLYQVTGDPAAIDESITMGRYGAKKLQPSTQAACLVLATLAASLQARAAGTGSAADLEEGINVARQAVAAAPDGSPWRPSAVDILAAGLRLRFELAGDVSNLSEAITLHREMADQVPGQRPEHSIHMLQVAATLMVRFERLRVREDLDAAEVAADQALKSGHAITRGQAHYLQAACLRERAAVQAASGDQEGAGQTAELAVAAAERALELTPPGSNSHPDCVVQLGNAKASRYRITRSQTHRTDAIASWQDAIRRLGDDQRVDQLCRLNLAHLYQLPAEGPASKGDLLESAELYRQVLASTDPSDRVWAPTALGLLRTLTMLVEIDRKAVSTDGAIHLYRQLAGAPAASPLMVTQAGLVTGRLLMRVGASVEAAETLAEAVRRLPAVAWRGIDRDSRESWLAEFSGIGSAAAASLLAVGRAEAAVEAVEQGRSVLWTDMLQLRRGDADLWQEDPQRAERLRDLAAALDAQEQTSGLDHRVSRAVDRRMALAAEWDALVGQVRTEGHQDFLQPPSFPDLLPAAAHGPVVIVNVSEYRCDAIIVTSDGARSVGLPALSAEQVTANTTRYLQAHARVDQAMAEHGDLQGARRDLEATLSQVLEWLWDTVAEPVLAALGFDDAPEEGQPWPRLWWCPTGLLTLFPLHAAGYHGMADGHARSVLDRVVSSYTPTLAALAGANRADPPASNPRKLLVVALPDTPGAGQDPGTSRERDLLSAKLGDHCRILFGAAASRAAVQAALPQHSWVHFSCHGRQDLTAPSEGGLLLHDGEELKIADLSVSSYAGEFVYLSACQTATGGAALPDEAISLAAAVQYAGYRHVVATLWEVYVPAAAEVTERVYAALTEAGPLDPARSADALHSALRSQRDSYRTTPSWWTPFIHIGP